MSPLDEHSLLARPVQDVSALLEEGGDEDATSAAYRSQSTRRVQPALALLVTGTVAAAFAAAGEVRDASIHRRGPGARARFGASSAVELAEEDCRTAKRGDGCHTDVVYAMRNRKLHPEWYIGLDNCSTFTDYQAFMHTQVLNSGARRCPKPCRDEGVKAKAHCQAKKKEKGKDCHTAVAGDACYPHVLYTQKEAIKYPRWYPGLSKESSLSDVQHYLKEENVCPEPCDLVADPNDTLKGEDCHSALPGESCYDDISLAKDTFIEDHPDWYPGLTNASSRDEFQAFLHSQRHVDAEAAKKACPNPCNDEAVELINLTLTCRTADLGDECYRSVLWGATEGITNHPLWYGGLRPNSTFEDFQFHLHKDNHTKCHHVPCPCHTAEKGEECYWSILWVLKTGLKKYPKTFGDLGSDPTFEEVQAHLHKERTNSCGRPCKTFDVPRSPWKPRRAAELDIQSHDG